MGALGPRSSYAVHILAFCKKLPAIVRELTVRHCNTLFTLSWRVDCYLL